MNNFLPARHLKAYQRWLMAVLAVVTLALVPTACGSGGGSGTKSTTTTTAPGY